MGICYFDCAECGGTIADCESGWHTCGGCGEYYCQWCLKDDDAEFLIRNPDINDDEFDDCCDEDRYVACVACTTDATRRKIVSDTDLVNWILKKRAIPRQALVNEFLAENCSKPKPPKAKPKRAKTSN